MSGQRQNQWNSLKAIGDFDVVVVGGGINGIGVYRELAMQGLRVLLVEKRDFCSGCSAAPSRMIHGGLRYLENGEFDLVRESLQERDALLRNAPHLVHPLPTVIPIKSSFSGLLNAAASFFGMTGKPANRGALPIKIGLSLYDWVIRKNRLMPKHAFYAKKAASKRWPHLLPDLTYAATYYDAWISHPERLGLELIRDVAAMSDKCVALNYAEIQPAGDGFKIIDTRSGTEAMISSPILVNATGAWLDDTIANLNGEAVAARLVSGTKGSHLILDNPQLEKALSGHMAYFENADGRICIVFPYMGKVLAGSTDIRVKEARRVRCEPEEEAYILASLRLVFPDIPISAEDVVFSFAGIRPLPTSDHDFTGRISRGHDIKRIDGTATQFCMVGGKWTTFRAFAEQTADQVLQALGRERLAHSQQTAIGGGKDHPETTEELAAHLCRTHQIEADRANQFARIYGTEANALLAFLSTLPNDHPLCDQSGMTIGEILYLLRHEHVETVADLILRRTTLAIRGVLSMASLEQILALFAKERGLSNEQADLIRNEILQELSNFYGVSQTMLESRNQEMELPNAS